MTRRSALLVLLAACLMPPVAVAQSRFDGRWKIDISSQMPKRRNVWLIRDRTYECESCTPVIKVKADGNDQAVAGQPFDTISVKVVDANVVEEVEKKKGKVVSKEKFTVSPDGNTVTDEFADFKITAFMVAKGPAGSHVMSGSWQNSKMEALSDSGLLLTLKVEGDWLHMLEPNGQSYTAKLDGTDAPYDGSSETTSVSVRRIGEDTIEETDKRGGKVASIARMTLSADGKTMAISVHDVPSGSATQFTATKQ